jgi:DNA-binding beta-propeller fold protein YncE
MPFEKRIKVKKIKRLDLTITIVNLGASRIANASRVDQSNNDNGCLGKWDISGAVYAEKNKSIGNEDIAPRNVAFNPDGTKMYVVGSQYDTIFQYSLSIAWDVSTATYAEKSKFVGSEDTFPQTATFNPDGTKMYLMAQKCMLWEVQTIRSINILYLQLGMYQQRLMSKRVNS